MTEPAIWKIRDWKERFEINQSRRVKRPEWVPVPTRQDGKRFRRLMARGPDGVQAFGIFIVFVQIASRMPEKGVLADDEGPLLPEDLAGMSSAPIDVIKSAITILSSPQIQWLQKHTKSRSEHAPRALRARSELEATERERDRETKRDRQTDRQSIARKVAEPTIPDSPKLWGDAKRGIQIDPLEARWYGIVDADLERWAGLYPGLNLKAELAKAAEWVKANPDRRKRNYPEFLRRWFVKSQEGARGSPSNLAGQAIRNQGGETAEQREARRGW